MSCRLHIRRRSLSVPGRPRGLPGTGEPAQLRHFSTSNIRSFQMNILREQQFQASRLSMVLEALVFVAVAAVIVWGAIAVCIPAARGLL